MARCHCWSFAHGADDELRGCEENPASVPANDCFPVVYRLSEHQGAAQRSRLRIFLGGSELQKLVQVLGLSRYKSNVSANFRIGTCFMHLDDNHILYFHTDPSTIPRPPTDSFVLATAWHAKVVKCSMLKSRDITVVERDIGAYEFEIKSGMRDPQSSP